MEAKKNTVRIWGNLLYLMFVFLSSKIAGLINSGTCPQSIEFNRIIIICSCFYWDGSVPSVCVILDSVQHKHHRSQINRIYISWSDTAEPSFPAHPSFRVHTSRSVTDQCQVSGSSAPLCDTIWKVSSFLVSDLQVALRSVRLMAPSRSPQWFDDTRTVLEDIIKNC